MYFPNTIQSRSMLHSFLSEVDVKVIGVTSGCFDILHPLHIQYLEKCRSQCDFLVVGVDSDRLIEEFKHKLSVQPEHDRAFMIGALNVVDVAFVMDKLSHLTEVLGTVSGQYRKEEDVRVHLYKNKVNYYGDPVLRLSGVDVIHIPDVYPMHLTTELVKFIQNDYQKL